MLLVALVAACGPPRATAPSATPGHADAVISATDGDAEALIDVAADLPVGTPPPPGLPVQPGNLQRALGDVRGPARLVLGPGHHLLAPTAFTDSSCGNCEEANTAVPASFGIRLSGRGIRLTGADPDQTIIHTNAGYGVLFDGCDGCVLERVTVTSGQRDDDGRATSAAVVVRNGAVTLANCVLRDNIGDSVTVTKTVVGIAGVAGRENADITVRSCRIERNSWDGIALYRGARATIWDNVVDGVDKASGARVGGGRGVGIGLTWDAHALVEGNLVRRYWKGIGVFVDARAEVRENIVEDILTWGLAYWAAGEGMPSGRFEDNVVFETGACGAMISRDRVGDDPGTFIGNVLVRTTQNPRYDSGEPYCTQRPIARAAVPSGFTMRDNLIHDVRQPGDAPLDAEVSRDALRRGAAELMSRLEQRPALRESFFFRRFWWVDASSR